MRLPRTSPAPEALPSLSVVIPTYLRPEWLRRAVHSLAAQDPVPDQVILVAREDDRATHATIAELSAERLPFAIRAGTVSSGGFLPPVREGFRLATAEVVAVLDDDAEAAAGWTSGLLRHYADPRVGGVGGRCVNMRGDEVLSVPTTSRVGFVSPLGHFVGNMYKRPLFDEPVYVDFLMGGCMSFRRTVAQRLEFDESLNANVGFGYEVDLGLQARAQGWKLVFDPAIWIRHFSAPRAVAGMRSLSDEDAVHWYSHNHLRVLARRGSGMRRVLGIAWGVLIGERRAPGLLPWAAGPIARRLGYLTPLAGSATRGRMRALRAAVSGRA